MATTANKSQLTNQRLSPLEISEDQFRRIGHELVDTIAGLLATLPVRPVTPAEGPAEVRAALNASQSLPEFGKDPGVLLRQAAELLAGHSLFNGNPRFWGYITSGAAPIGVLADMLASAVNANVGAWKLAPMATEIEAQTVRWIAEFLGYPTGCGGLLVSGGNMANITCFFAARAAQAGWDIRTHGAAAGPKLCVYASTETHTWLQKAVDLAGLGTDCIRWIPSDSDQRINIEALKTQVEQDRQQGHRPFLVVGSAGTVSTGAVDPLPHMAAFCREQELWFHVDGAYGAFAAAVPDAHPDFAGMALADSVAVDPHKWLYAPLEAGCVLVRDPAVLRNAFSYHPPYYRFDVDAINYFDYGPQNSRGFRALKVWLALQHAGAQGYRQMIADDIVLAAHLYDLAKADPEIQAFTHNLSITTFRYVPKGRENDEEYLNKLNQDLQGAIEKSGEAFLSNAVIDGKYLLRVCIVNFRTTRADIEALLPLVTRLGAQLALIPCISSSSRGPEELIGDAN